MQEDFLLSSTCLSTRTLPHPRLHHPHPITHPNLMALHFAPLPVWCNVLRAAVCVDIICIVQHFSTLPTWCKIMRAAVYINSKHTYYLSIYMHFVCSIVVPCMCVWQIHALCCTHAPHTPLRWTADASTTHTHVASLHLRDSHRPEMGCL